MLIITQAACRFKVRTGSKSPNFSRKIPPFLENTGEPPGSWTALLCGKSISLLPAYFSCYLP